MFASFWEVSETNGDQNPYSTEMDGEDLLLIIAVELEKDQNNLFLLVASATTDNKNGSRTVLMFGFDLKTEIASSVQSLESYSYLCIQFIWK